MQPCQHPAQHALELTFDSLISRHTSGTFCLVCGLRTGGALIRPAALGPDRLTPDELLAVRELRAATGGAWERPEEAR